MAVGSVPMGAELAPGGENCLQQEEAVAPAALQRRVGSVLRCGLPGWEEETPGFGLQRVLSFIITRLEHLKQTDSSTS